MMTQRAATDTGAAMVGAVAIRRSGEVSGARALNRNAYCAVRKIGDTPTGTAQSGGESERGGGPPLSVGSAGRAESLPRVSASARAFPANAAARGAV